MGALLTITDIERIYGSPLLEDFYSELQYMMKFTNWMTDKE